MKQKFIAVAFILIIFLPNFTFAQTKRKISLLLFNGKVFTADENFTTAEAVAVDGEKIVAVGTTNDLRAKYQAVKEIDLQGKLVTPGFNDAHVHFLRGALALLSVNLEGVKSLDAAKTQVAAKKLRKQNRANGLSGAVGIIRFGAENFRRGKDLDAVAPNNPVFLVRVDGHVGWVNSAAIETWRRLTKRRNHPEGGEIERDSNGEATGILKETSQGLVSNADSAAFAANR